MEDCPAVRRGKGHIMNEEKILVITEDENGTRTHTETITEEERDLLDAVSEPMDEDMKDEILNDLSGED